MSAAVHHVRVHPNADRCIELGVLVRHKLGRHHSDDLEGLCVESDGPTHRAGLPSETPLPKAVTQDYNRLSALLVFVWAKVASEERLHAQRAKKVRRDCAAAQVFRLAYTGQIEIPRLERRHLLEDVVLLLPIKVVWVGHGHVRLARIGFVQYHQPAGIVKGQRLEQNGFDDTKNRRVGANTQRQRDNRDGGEARVLREHPYPES